MSKDISVVVPLYNEEESLPKLLGWMEQVMQEHKYSYEAILIDDGSNDNSWEVIKEESARNANIKGIRFRRNYGKSAALNEGFMAARGKVVITMDADLQDSPEEIPDLYQMIAKDGYDLVSGWKRKRYDPVSKTVPSKFFNGVTRKMSGIDIHDFNCGLKAYKLEVVKNIEVYGEMHRYIPVIAKQAGFAKITEKVVQHRERKYGRTKFGWERFINGFLDLMSILFVSKFGKRPMHFFGTFGFFSFVLGGIVAVWIIAEKLISIYTKQILPPRDVTDQPLFYLALVAVVVGVQLFLAGFLGELIARNAPDRNIYQVDQKLNF